MSETLSPPRPPTDFQAAGAGLDQTIGHDFAGIPAIAFGFAGASTGKARGGDLSAGGIAHPHAAAGPGEEAANSMRQIDCGL